MGAIFLNANVRVKDFTNDLINELRIYIDNKLSHLAVSSDFEGKIKNEIDRQMTQSRHYQSLLGGDLRLHFGLENPLDDLNSIINTIKDSLRVEYTPLDAKLNGRFSVTLSVDVAYSKGGVYLSDGGIVNWLDWLLEAGSSVVVADFHIVKGVFESPKVSRTGGAIMGKGGNYSVPSEWAGTSGSNWITEVLEGLELYILQLIQKEFN